MKNLLFLLIIIASQINAQTLDFYTMNIDSTLDEYIIDAVEYKSDHYIVIGNRNDELNPLPNTYRVEDEGIIMKINVSGNIIQKLDLEEKQLWAIDKISDNEIAICGVNNNNNAWVAVIDSNLNIIWDWTKTVFEQNSNYEVFTHLIIQDTIVNVCGIVGQNLATDIYIAQISINGSYIQNTTITNVGYYLDILDVSKDYNEHDKYWVAIKNLILSPFAETTLLQIDKNLNFTDTISILNDKMITSFEWFNEENLLIGGDVRYIDTFIPPAPPNTYIWNDLLFAKINVDSLLTPLTGLRTYFGREDTSDIASSHTSLDYTQKDLIYLGGTSNMYRQYGPYLEAPGFHHNDTWLLINCLDSMGNLQWQRYFGGDENYYLTSIRATEDGGVLLLGTSFDYNSGVNRRNIHIIKLNNDILDNTDFVEFDRQVDIKLYPNPISNFLQFEIKTDNIQSESFNLQVYNINGQLLMQKQMRTGLSRFNTQNLLIGTYFYSITNGKNELIKSGQFIKLE